MSEVVVDAALGKKLSQAEGMVPICDPSGKVLGVFQPFYQAKDSEKAKRLSPFSDEEIEQLCQQRTGRPLPEIWEEKETQLFFGDADDRSAST